jgi:hypothetical protein
MRSLSFLAAVLLALLVSPTAPKAADVSDCAAVDRELQAAGVDPWKRLDILQACADQNMIERELDDEADRSFARGAADLARGAAAWPRPVYVQPRPLYCTWASDRTFICQ